MLKASGLSEQCPLVVNGNFSDWGVGGWGGGGREGGRAVAGAVELKLTVLVRQAFDPFANSEDTSRQHLSRSWCLSARPWRRRRVSSGFVCGLHY